MLSKYERLEYEEQLHCSDCGGFLEKVEAEYGSEAYQEFEENRVPGSWTRDVCNNPNCDRDVDFDREQWEAPNSRKDAGEGR